MGLDWETADGSQRFALDLLGYEFPEGAEDDHDANWLVVRVAARDGDLAWSAEDPCLLTWEIGQLARWLERLARGQFDRLWRGFSEPNLEFRADRLPPPAAATASETADASPTAATMAPAAPATAAALAAGVARAAGDSTPEPVAAAEAADGPTPVPAAGGRARGARVRVYFELELRPPGRASRAVGKRDVYLTFDLQPAQLRASARALREAARPYPVREAGT